MTRQAEQKMRFSDVELSLMKNTFADNDDLLFSLRKSFLGFELEKGEKKLIKDCMSEQVFALLSKALLPKVEHEAPLFQLADMYMSLSTDMKTLGVEAAAPLIAARQLEIDYIEQELAILENIDAPLKRIIALDDLISLKKDRDAEQLYVAITARNYLLSWIDSNIQQIKFLSGKKEESVEETKERLIKNSAK